MLPGHMSGAVGTSKAVWPAGYCFGKKQEKSLSQGISEMQ